MLYQENKISDYLKLILAMLYFCIQLSIFNCFILVVFTSLFLEIEMYISCEKWPKFQKMNKEIFGLHWSIQSA